MTTPRAPLSLLIVPLALLALAPACSAPSPGQAPPAASAQPAPAGTAAAAPLAESSRALLALLPDEGTVPGWGRKSDVRFYGTNSLWDFIDGGADAYLACGFEEVVTSEYVSAAAPSGIMVDVYRMADPGGAFGIFSQERSPKSEPRSIGAEGYLAGTTLNFWTNAYYVKLTAFQESEANKAVMAQLAAAVSRKLGTPGPKPASSGRERCGAAAGE